MLSLSLSLSLTDDNAYEANSRFGVCSYGRDPIDERFGEKSLLSEGS
jgi:hypothetical protein